MADARLIDGRYRLVKVVGRGAMGEVWLAHDEMLGRSVAVKRLNVDTVTRDSDAFGRAVREARLAAALDHPNVVAVYDFVVEDDRPYVVMTYVPGETLGERVRRQGPLPAAEAAGLLRGIADALASAHARGIVHRDVKPGNVLIGENGSARLADFGVARGMSEATLTANGLVVGSMAFMAPEIAMGSVATPASDVWSLGATLYEAVEGHPPFQAANPGELMLKLVQTTVPAPQRAGALTPLLMQMLDRRAEARPTAAEVRDRLGAVAPSAPPSEPPHLSGPAEGRPQRRARRILLVAAGAVGAAAIAGAAFAFWPSGSSSRHHGIGRTSAAPPPPPSGTVWTWGDAGGGAARPVPVRVSGVTRATAVAVGYAGAASGASLVSYYAVDLDGALWAWGDNTWGQLGDGTTVRRATPVRLAGLPHVVGVAAGDGGVHAVGVDGTLWAWGHNHDGNLGDGTEIDRHQPERITGLSGVAAVAGANYALSRTGTVWAWGPNWGGQVGDGTLTTRSAPVALALSNVTAITAESRYGVAFALRRDGTVWGWGVNRYDELNDGTTTPHPRPVPVAGVASARAIVAGSGIGFALRADGTVAGWGSDSAGQLGNGGPAVTSRRGPVTVSGLTHVRAIAAGDAGYAVLGDGTVSAWGVNTRGQLGDGASTSTDLPVSVTGLHDVIAISASGGAAVAIVRAG